MLAGNFNHSFFLGEISNIGAKFLSQVSQKRIVNAFLYLVEHKYDRDDFFLAAFNLLKNYLSLEEFVFLDSLSDGEKGIVSYCSSQVNLEREFVSLVGEFSKYYDSLPDKEKRDYLFFGTDQQNLPDNLVNLFIKYQLKYVNLIRINYRGKYFGDLLIYGQKNQSIKSREELEILKDISKYYGCFLYQIALEKKSQQKTLRDHVFNKSQYISRMSHELRTPISAVIGFARMLKQQLYGKLNTKQLQYVSAIYESGIYLLELINDLLDISKIEAETETIFLEEVEIGELCQSSLSLIGELAKQKGLKVNLIVNDSIDCCLADGRKLKQILVNLLSNAVKFTEFGSVTLQVAKKDDQLQFSVSDTGIGIKKSDRPQLFQPFSQLNTPLHRKYKGTGLGLAISKQLAQLHGGDITVVSAEGKGSCFTLYIPYQKS